MIFARKNKKKCKNAYIFSFYILRIRFYSQKSITFASFNFNIFKFMKEFYVIIFQQGGTRYCRIVDYSSFISFKNQEKGVLNLHLKNPFKILNIFKVSSFGILL